MIRMIKGGSLVGSNRLFFIYEGNMSDKSFFIREKKERNYTVMCNNHLRNEKLSWKGKGLMSYLLSLPDDWQIYLSELEKHATDGKDSLRTAIKELEEQGYLSKKQRINKKGYFDGYEYTIYEIPKEIPVAENPSTDNPKTENPPLLITDIYKYTDSTNEFTLSNESEEKPKEVKHSKPEKPKKEKKPKEEKTQSNIEARICEIKDFTDTHNLNQGIYENLCVFINWLNRMTKGGVDGYTLKLHLADLLKFAGENQDKMLEIIKNTIKCKYRCFYDLKQNIYNNNQQLPINNRKTFLDL